MAERPALDTLTYELLSQITLLLSIKTLLALSLTSTQLSTWSRIYIYRTVKFPCTAGSLGRSEELYERLTRNGRLASLVRKLEVGRDPKSSGEWERNLEHGIPNLLELLAKLSELQILILRIPFDIEILKLIALRHPTIKMVLDYPINTLGNDLVSLRAIRLITHCALAINVNFFRELRGVVEAMRGFAHLRHLELSICGNFINLPNALCHELRGHLNIILPRLEYLSISGQLPRGTRSNAPLSVMNPQGWDLSLLETLRVEDEITCTDLYENLTLTRLKHLLCNRPSFETGPDVAEEFQRLLSRNKDLESLRMVGLTSRSDLLLLSSLGTRLHTLDLAQGSYVEDAQQFATLASLLPNLINLSVFVTHTVTWPYTSLAAVADSFPAIQYLRLRTVPQLVSTRCKIVHRLDGAWSGAYDTIMCENPSTDLDLASKAWRYFWSILVKSNNSSLSQSSGNPTRLSTSPRIETLVLRTERVQALPPFIAGGLRHEFRANRSERLEDSRSGVATVSSQTVENYESYLQDCAFGTDMEDLGNQSHRDVLNLRWTLRVVAEFGPDTRFWPDLGPYELNSEFGRPSVVVP